MFSHPGGERSELGQLFVVSFAMFNTIRCKFAKYIRRMDGEATQGFNHHHTYLEGSDGPLQGHLDIELHASTQHRF